MPPYLHLLRPHQWIKNFFLYLPAFFAQRITEGLLVGKISLTVIGFSAIASSVYIFNDYQDREDDRLHPSKRNRPLAAGTVSINSAFTLFGVLLIMGFSLLFWVSLQAGYWALGYLFLNLAYSLFLKQIPIIDLYLIAMGFVIRIALGASVDAIPLSMWIILMTFLLALFIGLAKRRDDVSLAAEGKNVRKSISGYNLPFINGAMMIMASVLIVSYISYTISADTQEKFSNPYLYVTVFFVILGILRYMQLTLVEERSGTPTLILWKDRFLQLTILGWLISFVVLIY
ncbi:MAG: UbiA prenyltransferase family protein [Bacteroidota bacterium]